MPHDIDGRQLRAGDRVTLECTVRDVTPGEEFCNCTLETVETMHPGEGKVQVVINARQCRLAHAAAGAEGDVPAHSAGAQGG